LTALAKSVERDLIEDEMRQQAAKQIIRQLARLRASFDSNSVDTGTLDSLDTIPEAGQEVPLDQDDLYRDPVAEEILQEQQEANQTLSIE
jgi:LPS-assembly lipoprotein